VCLQTSDCPNVVRKNWIDHVGINKIMKFYFVTKFYFFLSPSSWPFKQGLISILKFILFWLFDLKG